MPRITCPRLARPHAYTRGEACDGRLQGSSGDACPQAPAPHAVAQEQVTASRLSEAGVGSKGAFRDLIASFLTL